MNEGTLILSFKELMHLKMALNSMDDLNGVQQKLLDKIIAELKMIKQMDELEDD